MASWNRKYATSFHLNDGRTLSTLAQARELLLDLPHADQAKPHWASAGEILARAASSWGHYLPFDGAGKPFRALRSEGLL